MRIVFVGASELALRTTQQLLDRGDEVVVIEADGEKIERLSDEVACGFLHGDGSQPDILREAGPEKTDVIFCITDNDLVNIVASVASRSLEFSRVVTKIENPQYLPLCREIGLIDTIVPSATISRYLADLATQRDILELSTFIKGEARFFSWTVAKPEAGATIAELDLPEEARAICFYRDGEFHLAEANDRLKADDEVVVLTHSRHLKALRDRWQPQEAVGKPQPSDGESP